MVNARVLSTHFVDGKIVDIDKDFVDKDEALEYAKNLKCITVRVFEKEVGVVYFHKPGVHGVDEE
jgi:hypothetical protein